VCCASYPSLVLHRDAKAASLESHSQVLRLLKVLFNPLSSSLGHYLLEERKLSWKLSISFMLAWTGILQALLHEVMVHSKGLSRVILIVFILGPKVRDQNGDCPVSIAPNTEAKV
jgi:hypothetical protein